MKISYDSLASDRCSESFFHSVKIASPDLAKIRRDYRGIGCYEILFTRQHNAVSKDLTSTS